MKKSLIVLLILLSIGLFGCEKKEESVLEEETIVKEINVYNRTYYDKNHMINNGSAEEIALNSDDTVFYRKCENRGTCSFYTGVFEIKDDKLIVTLKETQSKKEVKWEKLSKEEVMEFDITEENTFIRNVDGYESEFVLE